MHSAASGRNVAGAGRFVVPVTNAKLGAEGLLNPTTLFRGGSNVRNNGFGRFSEKVLMDFLRMHLS